MSTTIRVRAKPSSTKGPLVETDPEGNLIVYVREPPVDGKANQALIKLLADHFDVPKSHVEVVRGHKSRHKTVRMA